ncbi:MAG: DUF262 domain-containing protein [Paludibacteraceae bacterium]|nr:DUF262 domain-containing protein [Paludibacteraceae bacterium]
MDTNNTTVKSTFWDFIKQYKIEIPIIQRDYAQGRLGKENLRKGFLSDLKKALDNPQNEMKLDFVYGSTDNDTLFPLDGQQRLTTLWLLHWYIALRADCLTQENCQIFKKFSYETRISSREFCQNLCEYEYFKQFDGNDIVSYIKRQTWFYSVWKQDPTIQSMLRMLGGTNIHNKKGEDIVDGLEEIFSDTEEREFKEYWNILTTTICPIVFYHLPLDNFGLSDDLYIKMNARGKQLTSFENFKADLIGYIRHQAYNENLSEEVHVKWERLLDPAIGIPIKMDTTWTDLFWNNRSKGIKQADGNIILTDQIDEIYYAFLNRFFWNELFNAKDAENKYILTLNGRERENSSYFFLNDEKNDKGYDEKIAYQGLDVYKYFNGEIPLECFEKLMRILDNLHNFKGNIPICSWNNSFKFVPEYENVKDENGIEREENIKIINNSSDSILKVTTLTQIHRITFFGLCKYFNEDAGDEISLKRWMRVVWNLISGEASDGRPQIRSTDAMRSAIEIIDKLDSHNVYESLNEDKAMILSKGNRLSDIEQRYKEEVEKAKKILEARIDNRSWENDIIIAENEAFFKGAIRFLFTDENGTYNWSDFDIKAANAKCYFDRDGVRKDYSPILMRRLISYYDDWGMFFNITYDSTKETWLKMLLEDKWKKPIHKLLFDNSQNDLVAFQSPLADSHQKRIHEEMVQSNILQYIEKGCFLNDRTTYQILYPYNAHAEWKKYIIGSNRNPILSSLCDSKTISTKQRLNKTCNFFWGWDVTFKYSEKDFIWTWNNKLVTYFNDKRIERELSQEESIESIQSKLEDIIKEIVAIE